MKSLMLRSDKHLQSLLFLAGLSLFLSVMEYLIPKPLPFMRLGIANIPIILALGLFSWREIMLLVLLKVLGQAMVNGTLASYIFLFSLAGTLTSSLVMIISWYFLKRWISAVGISILGAMSSNLMQLLLSIFLVFGKNARYIAPLFLVTGFVSGFIMGLFCNQFIHSSVWYKKFRQSLYEG